MLCVTEDLEKQHDDKGSVDIVWRFQVINGVSRFALKSPVTMMFRCLEVSAARFLNRSYGERAFGRLYVYCDQKFNVAFSEFSNQVFTFISVLRTRFDQYLDSPGFHKVQGDTSTLFANSFVPKEIVALECVSLGKTEYR